ncbi:MAG: sigma-70 family RNA polymerase sigma factor [Vulcanimicrobiaceae bacterium]
MRTKIAPTRSEFVRMRPQASDIPSDEALLRRIARRDQTAFRIAYQRHASAVMAIVQRQLGDRDRAADLTQQTFVRLWEHAESVHVRDGRLRPWLLAVARNAALDVGRRKTVASAFAGRLFAAQHVEADIAEDIADRAQARATRDLLTTLGAEQRTIVELAYFGGLTQSEIAATLRIPLGTVKSRLRLALQHLRDRARDARWELG